MIPRNRRTQQKAEKAGRGDRESEAEVEKGSRYEAFGSGCVLRRLMRCERTVSPEFDESKRETERGHVRNHGEDLVSHTTAEAKRAEMGGREREREREGE